MRTPTLRPVAVAGLAVVALVLPGCGGGSADLSALTELTAQEVLAKAGETSAAEKSGSFTMEMSGTGSVALSMKGEGKYTAEPEYATAMSLSDMSFGGETIPGGIEMRLIGEVMYLKMPGLGELAGFEWVKMDLNALGDTAGLDLDELLKQQQLNDPRAQLQILLNSGDVQAVGEEEIDGVKTMHYTGTVDPDKIIAQQGFDAEIQEALKDAYTELGVTEIAFELWVDGDFQTRRMIMNMPTSDGALTISMNLGDFGKPVTVEAPANATDFAELAGSLDG